MPLTEGFWHCTVFAGGLVRRGMHCRSHLEDMRSLHDGGCNGSLSQGKSSPVVDWPPWDWQSGQRQGQQKGG